MPTYIARFTIVLKSPIQTSETSFPTLRVPGHRNFVKETLIKAEPSNGALHELRVEVTYSADDLAHGTIAGAPASERGIMLSGQEGIIQPPWDTAMSVLGPLLYHISGLTLQAGAYRDITKNLSRYVKDFTWQMPDGIIVPSFEDGYPIGVLRNLTDSGVRALSLDDWNTLQTAVTGSGSSGAPLWRLILADGHRERGNDVRKVVLWCAMALDVGISQFIQAGKFGDFNIDLFCCRGEWKKKGSRTPDLRTIDLALFNTLARLWYTRHGIVHRGQSNVYDKRPTPGVLPVDRLTIFYADQFLCAVPKGVAFVEANPP